MGTDGKAMDIADENSWKARGMPRASETSKSRRPRGSPLLERAQRAQLAQGTHAEPGAEGAAGTRKSKGLQLRALSDALVTSAADGEPRASDQASRRRTADVAVLANVLTTLNSSAIDGHSPPGAAKPGRRQNKRRETAEFSAITSLFDDSAEAAAATPADSPRVLEGVAATGEGDHRNVGGRARRPQVNYAAHEARAEEETRAGGASTEALPGGDETADFSFLFVRSTARTPPVAETGGSGDTLDRGVSRIPKTSNEDAGGSPQAKERAGEPVLTPVTSVSGGQDGARARSSDRAEVEDIAEKASSADDFSPPSTSRASPRASRRQTADFSSLRDLFDSPGDSTSGLGPVPKPGTRQGSPGASPAPLPTEAHAPTDAGRAGVGSHGSDPLQTANFDFLRGLFERERSRASADGDHAAPERAGGSAGSVGDSTLAGLLGSETLSPGIAGDRRSDGGATVEVAAEVAALLDAVPGRASATAGALATPKVHPRRQSIATAASGELFGLLEETPSPGDGAGLNQSIADGSALKMKKTLAPLYDSAAGGSVGCDRSRRRTCERGDFESIIGDLTSSSSPTSDRWATVGEREDAMSKDGAPQLPATANEANNRDPSDGAVSERLERSDEERSPSGAAASSPPSSRPPSQEDTVGSTLMPERGKARGASGADFSAIETDDYDSPMGRPKTGRNSRRSTASPSALNTLMDDLGIDFGDGEKETLDGGGEDESNAPPAKARGTEASQDADPTSSISDGAGAADVTGAASTPSPGVKTPSPSPPVARRTRSKSPSSLSKTKRNDPGDASFLSPRPAAKKRATSAIASPDPEVETPQQRGARTTKDSGSRSRPKGLKSCLSSRKRARGPTGPSPGPRTTSWRAGSPEQDAPDDSPRSPLPAGGAGDDKSPRVPSAPSTREMDITLETPRRVMFGAPMAAEFNHTSPSNRLTPMPSRDAKTLFPLEKQEQEADTDEDEDTAANSRQLAEWDGFEPGAHSPESFASFDGFDGFDGADSGADGSGAANVGAAPKRSPRRRESLALKSPIRHSIAAYSQDVRPSSGRPVYLTSYDSDTDSDTRAVENLHASILGPEATAAASATTAATAGASDARNMSFSISTSQLHGIADSDSSLELTGNFSSSPPMTINATTNTSSAPASKLASAAAPATTTVLTTARRGDAPGAGADAQVATGQGVRASGQEGIPPETSEDEGDRMDLNDSSELAYTLGASSIRDVISSPSTRRASTGSLLDLVEEVSVMEKEVISEEQGNGSTTDDDTQNVLSPVGGGNGDLDFSMVESADMDVDYDPAAPDATSTDPGAEAAELAPASGSTQSSGAGKVAAPAWGSMFAQAEGARLATVREEMSPARSSWSCPSPTLSLSDAVALHDGCDAIGRSAQAPSTAPLGSADVSRDPSQASPALSAVAHSGASPSPESGDAFPAPVTVGSRRDSGSIGDTVELRLDDFGDLDGPSVSSPPKGGVEQLRGIAERRRESAISSDHTVELPDLASFELGSPPPGLASSTVPVVASERSGVFAAPAVAAVRDAHGDGETRSTTRSSRRSSIADIEMEVEHPADEASGIGVAHPQGTVHVDPESTDLYEKARHERKPAHAPHDLLPQQVAADSAASASGKRRFSIAEGPRSLTSRNVRRSGRASSTGLDRSVARHAAPSPEARAPSDAAVKPVKQTIDERDAPEGGTAASGPPVPSGARGSTAGAAPSPADADAATAAAHRPPLSRRASSMDAFRRGRVTGESGARRASLQQTVVVPPPPASSMATPDVERPDAGSAANSAPPEPGRPAAPALAATREAVAAAIARPLAPPRSRRASSSAVQGVGGALRGSSLRVIMESRRRASIAPAGVVSRVGGASGGDRGRSSAAATGVGSIRRLLSTSPSVPHEKQEQQQQPGEEEACSSDAGSGTSGESILPDGDGVGGTDEAESKRQQQETKEEADEDEETPLTMTIKDLLLFVSPETASADSGTIDSALVPAAADIFGDVVDELPKSAVDAITCTLESSAAEMEDKVAVVREHAEASADAAWKLHADAPILAAIDRAVSGADGGEFDLSKSGMSARVQAMAAQIKTGLQREWAAWEVHVMERMTSEMDKATAEIVREREALTARDMRNQETAAHVEKANKFLERARTRADMRSRLSTKTIKLTANVNKVSDLEKEVALLKSQKESMSTRKAAILEGKARKIERTQVAEQRHASIIQLMDLETDGIRLEREALELNDRLQVLMGLRLWCKPVTLLPNEIVVGFTAPHDPALKHQLRFAWDSDPRVTATAMVVRDGITSPDLRYLAKSGTALIGGAGSASRRLSRLIFESDRGLFGQGNARGAAVSELETVESIDDVTAKLQSVEWYVGRGYCLLQEVQHLEKSYACTLAEVDAVANSIAAEATLCVEVANWRSKTTLCLKFRISAGFACTMGKPHVQIDVGSVEASTVERAICEAQGHHPDLMSVTRAVKAAAACIAGNIA